MRRTGIQSFLAKLLPDGVEVTCIDLSDEALISEHSNIAPPQSVPKRQREFVAGRLAASRSLVKLGQLPYFPAVGDEREPIWPDGFVGSITHDDELAVAAVASHDTLRAIGIDIESLGAATDSLLNQVISRRELDAWNATQTGKDDALLSIFSYKESVFKAIYPLTMEYLEFLDVTVLPPLDAPVMTCNKREMLSGVEVERLIGKISRYGDRIVSACWLPR